MVILEEGTLCIITGHMGSGKTYFANVITEKESDYFHFYTNINYFKPESVEKAKMRGLLQQSVEYREVPPRVHVTNKMSELLLGLVKTTPNVVVLDEAMIFAGFDRHGSKILRWFKDFVTQCRKLDTSVILVTQVKSQLTKLLREQLEHYECFCYKKGKKHMVRMMKLYPMDLERRDTERGPTILQNVITTLPYDTKSPASLQMDIDMEGFLGDASSYDSLELREHIAELVEAWKINLEPKKKKEKGPTLREQARKLKEEGMTTKEIVKILKCSPETVQKA